MPIFATAGSKVFIGGALAAKNADFVEADFDAQVWVEVGSMENIGSLGDTSAEITFDDIGKNRTQKLKGTRNAGNCELVMGIDYADAGQIALLAAEKTPHDYAFKIEFNDKPASGASPKNSERLFVAKVMSAAEALDQANNVMKLNATLGINSNVVRVNASAA
ncbi:hypothetical protein GHK50_29860 [Sinorhizobium medicae]|uniref:Phage tail protein n=1 Tax=Sinorhizobium medicae TaxID=110321 RepID=A0A6G1WDQ8_9HYPH|nr:MULTISPECIES: hypothetical protein [Sinorhizobium]ASP85474.1 hypothetical protein CDO26_13255 [Sinorhizobium meliloti]MQW26681.1 hypothetical protein [Sinorhizobium meliloti]MQW67861.1 hypothetical protein [Sinorhizobium medicae]MQX87084.1 hypothetical protein [Sinorhizobium medicae]